MRQPSTGTPLALLFSLLLVLGGCGGADRPGSSADRESTRLLIVGWDGATFDLIDPLVAAGRLPSVASLLERGASRRLASTVVPISSAAWVAAVTGKGPGQTGVYSFFEPVEGGNDARLISSRSNRALPLWRILKARGRRVNVFGIPVTYPPEPVLGTLVAGMLSPFDADYTWPAEYADELRARGFVPDLGIWREDQALSWAVIEQQLGIKEAALVELLERPDWDLSFVVFKSLDVLSHRVYDGRPDTLVARLLERLDGTLGRLVEVVGPDTHVLLLSDHGFAAYPSQFNLHHWLIEEGWSVERPSSTASAPPTGPLATARAAERRRRLGTLEMERTRAFATACEGNFGSLRLNLAGREADGIVDDAEREATLDELAQALRAIRRPRSDEPLVTEVWRGAELYPGRYAERVVPDLLFEVATDVHVVASTYQESFTTHPRPFPEHARDGIWILAGPGVEHNSQRGTGSILDVTPTALTLLGLPVYHEMEGVALTENLRAIHSPPAPIHEEGDAALEALDGLDPYDPAAQAEVEARLHGLGYTD